MWALKDECSAIKIKLSKLFVKHEKDINYIIQQRNLKKRNFFS